MKSFSEIILQHKSALLDAWCGGENNQRIYLPWHCSFGEASTEAAPLSRDTKQAIIDWLVEPTSSARPLPEALEKFCRFCAVQEDSTAQSFAFISKLKHLIYCTLNTALQQDLAGWHKFDQSLDCLLFSMIDCFFSYKKQLNRIAIEEVRRAEGSVFTVMAQRHQAKRVVL